MQRIYQELNHERAYNDPRRAGAAWAATEETFGAYECFTGMGDKYSVAFGRGIIDSIPPGSIYFGGINPGRFLVTALCKSQVQGDPFFTITQNALADSSYLDYLRGMSGDEFYVRDRRRLEALLQ